MSAKFVRYISFVMTLLVTTLNVSGQGIAKSFVTPEMLMSSTWTYNSSFLYATGSVAIQFSGNNYWHNAMTSGYNRSSTGGSTPASVKVQALSYETSDVHPSPCHNRYSSLITGNGQVNTSTTPADVFACGGSPNGYHTYWGFGFHWVGTLYAQTDVH